MKYKFNANVIEKDNIGNYPTPFFVAQTAVRNLMRMYRELIAISFVFGPLNAMKAAFVRTGIGFYDFIRQEMKNDETLTEINGKLNKINEKLDALGVGNALGPIFTTQLNAVDKFTDPLDLQSKVLQWQLKKVKKVEVLLNDNVGPEVAVYLAKVAEKSPIRFKN